jgi:hypothetical protein
VCDYQWAEFKPIMDLNQTKFGVILILLVVLKANYGSGEDPDSA